MSQVPANDSLTLKERRANKADFTRYSTVKGVVYHATDADFSEFDTQRSDLGAHFGTIEQANRVAEVRLGRVPGQGGANVIPAFINLQRPLRLKDVGTFHADGIADQLERKGILKKGEGKRILKEIDADWKLRKVYDPLVRQAIAEAGYDGIVYANETEGKGDSYIVFHPTQVKSAVGNSGLFDRNNPDMTDRRVTAAQEALAFLESLPSMKAAPHA